MAKLPEKQNCLFGFNAADFMDLFASFFSTIEFHADSLHIWDVFVGTNIHIV